MKQTSVYFQLSSLTYGTQRGKNTLHNMALPEYMVEPENW